MPPNTVGPVACILCPSAQHVARIARATRHYMASPLNHLSEWSVVEAAGRRETQRIKAELLNGCAVLVTTAPCWQRMLAEAHQPLVDARRLRLLACDDLDQIVERFRDEFTAVYTRMALQPPSSSAAAAPHQQSSDAGAARSQLQLVLTARRWRPEFEYFFGGARDLVLVIGAYAEAAVYAGAHVQLQRQRATSKLDQLVASVRSAERDARSQATVCVCNEAAEARAVEQRLRQELIDYCVYHEDSGDAERAIAGAWNAAAALDASNPMHRPRTLAVLVCTDRTIAELRLGHAQNIVHYSVPATWTAFAYRFAACFDYFEDRVRHREATVRTAPHSLVLLDEQNTVQLPKLIEFMESHGRRVEDARVQRLVARCRAARERERDGAVTEFCGTQLLVGECALAGCPRRHRLSVADGTPAEAGLPRAGHVRLVVHRVVAATELWARLEARRESRAAEWRREQEFVWFGLAFGNWYGRRENRRAVEEEVRVGVLAVIEGDGGDGEGSGVFHRCRVQAIR